MRGLPRYVSLRAAAPLYQISNLMTHDPPADRDVVIMECVGMFSNESEALQSWRRDLQLVWMSQLLRGDGRTVRWRYRAAVKLARSGNGHLATVMNRIFPSAQKPGNKR